MIYNWGQRVGVVLVVMLEEAAQGTLQVGPGFEASPARAGARLRHGSD